MEQAPKDVKMKGVLIVDDENQPEPLKSASNVVAYDEPKNVSLTSYESYDEGELPEATDGDDDDDSSDDSSTDSDDEMFYESEEDLAPIRPASGQVKESSSYKIVKPEELRECQEDKISEVTIILSVSRVLATILLLFYHWSTDILTEAWFNDPEEVRRKLGLYHVPAAGFDSTTCAKCSGPVPEYLDSEAFCCHKFCNACWKDIIGKSVKDSRLILRCPAENCDAAVNQDVVSMMASETDQRLYAGIVARTYLAGSNRGKRCPTPGCNHCVLLDSGDDISKFTCVCFHTYCYKCLKEAHQPVGCATVAIWRTESLQQNRNWRVACVRNCPKCDRQLEVKAWHKRVECTSCKIHFCGSCQCSWLEHGIWEGDHYTHICPQAKLKECEEVEKNRAKAINDFTRYQELVRHWNIFNMDQQQVLMKLPTMQHEELKVLAESQHGSLSDVSFVNEALLQLAECKRVFKWASVYDYYFLMFAEGRKSLYNDLTRQGAYVMEKLFLCASELRKFIVPDAPKELYKDFQETLCLKTRVARNYFGNMEVVIQQGYKDMASLRSTSSSSKSVKHKPETDVGTSSGCGLKESSDEPSLRACEHCTFPNDSSAEVCVMCYH